MNALETKGQAVKKSTEDWFSQFIHSLEIKKLQYEQDLMEPEDKKFIENLASENLDRQMAEITITSQKYYFGNLVSTFFNEFFITRKSKNPNKLGFNHKGQQIMVWIEVPAGDLEMENNIYLAEAVTNAKYEETGFSISATVVEEEDGLNIPSHYSIVK